MPVYHIQPQDLLFFRDARPMEPQSPGGGHGARWPLSTVFFDAIHAALWRAYPEYAHKKTTGFHSHGFYRKKDGARVQIAKGGIFFQTLTTAGPFPVTQNKWLFPAPSDAQPGGGLLHPITCQSGKSDLPKPLLHPVGSAAAPSKEGVSAWWSKNAIETYLAGGSNPCAKEVFKEAEIFENEWTTGIGIDSASGVQDGEHIYSAQYMRLRDQASLGLWASLPEEPGFEGLDQLFRPQDNNTILIVGGQQRACRVERQKATDLASFLPVSWPLKANCTRLKWVMLSPAVYPEIPKRAHPGGWLPTWIHPSDGSVLLNRIDKNRPANPTPRAARREAQEMNLLQQCHLVAACIPKPIPITGWTQALHVPEGDTRKHSGPRATYLAVPAGAVYYFECTTTAAAEALWELLSWHGSKTSKIDSIVHRRSSVLGEKGLGLGVCGPWESFEKVSAPR